MLKPATNAAIAVGIAMGLYQMVSSQYLFVEPLEHQNIHLAFALVLSFLNALKTSKKRWFSFLLLAMILLSLLSTAYVQVFYHELQTRVMFNTAMDLVISVILIILVLEATRECFGIILPIIALIFVAYAFFGYLLPGVMRGGKILPTELASYLCIGLSGVYGPILNVSANMIFLFVLFGGLMSASGATRFFLEMGKLAGRRLRGGPAITAVASSTMMGMVTGQAGANVAITGTFTIPLMKSVGYKPEQAGAIEAAASTGGQIMPPIMGAAAFIVADVMGVSYVYLITIAILPAALYFLTMGIYVQLQAMKLNISQARVQVDVREILLSAPTFFIPLIIIIILLMQGYSVGYVACWAIVSNIIVGLIRKKTRPSLGQWIEGFATGAARGATIGVACGTIGLIVMTVSLSGLGIKFPALVELLSRGNMVLALVMTMIATIILGCGMPTMAAYMLVAIVAAPVLLEIGVGVVPTHFFIFMFACFSFITPPVGIAAMIGAKMAESSYMKTAIEALKAGLAGFLLPFMFIFCPILLLQTQEPLPATTGVAAVLMVLLASQIAIVGYYLNHLNMWNRALFAICALSLMAHIMTYRYAFFIIGVILFATLTMWQIMELRSARAIEEIAYE